MSALRAEVSLALSPSPGTADIDLAIQELEALRMITSTTCILTGERQVRHHRRRPRPVITDMTIHDTIVTVASLALMAWIVYIVYRH